MGQHCANVTGSRDATVAAGQKDSDRVDADNTVGSSAHSNTATATTPGASTLPCFQHASGGRGR